MSVDISQLTLEGSEPKITVEVSRERKSENHSSFEYSALRDTDIRLVRFRKHSSNAEKPGSPVNDHVKSIQGEKPGTSHIEGLDLELETFNISNAPSYLALSYVWGDPNDTVQITLCSQYVFITRNLYNALRQISECSRFLEQGLGGTKWREDKDDCSECVELYLWIDAVCLNQQDLQEKASQVPRMAQIYSSAFIVLIWFGTLEQYVEEHEADSAEVEFPLTLAINQLERNVPFSQVPFPRPIRKLIPVLNTTVELRSVVRGMAHAYWSLLTNKWFDRCWVVQEYVLSQRDPCVLLGKRMFPFRALFDSANDFKELSNIDYFHIHRPLDLFRRKFDGALQRSFGHTYLPSDVASDEFKTKSFAHKLIHLLNRIHGKASIPQDRLYSLLGLVDGAEIPQNLLPDYRQSYTHVCQEYTRYLIENTGDLRLLGFEGRRTQLQEGAPSWIADFNSMTGMKGEVRTPHAGCFSEDGCKLIVEGVNLGVALATFFMHDSELKPTFDQMHAAWNWFRMYVIADATKIRQEDESSVYREWLQDFLVQSCGYEPGVRQRHTGLHMDDDHITLQPCDGKVYDSADQIDSQEVLSIFYQSQFLLLSDGSVKQCHQRVSETEFSQSTSFLYAFKGSLIPSIITQISPDEYRLVGNLRSTWYAKAAMDDEFFSNNKVEQITLV